MLARIINERQYKELRVKKYITRSGKVWLDVYNEKNQLIYRRR